jgi:hypothetical protein
MWYSHLKYEQKIILKVRKWNNCFQKLGSNEKSKRMEQYLSKNSNKKLEELKSKLNWSLLTSEKVGIENGKDYTKKKKFNKYI